MSSVTTQSSTSSASNSAAGVTAITNQSQYNAAYTQFLSMLTTELQNQDPTSPMDTTQFTNQLVGFSQLEQQLQSNSSLSTLVSDQSTSGQTASLGYLGHTVLASGSTFTLNATSPTNITYSLSAAATTASMSVINGAGATVATIPVTTAAGQNTYSYDGGDGNGGTLPPGQYTYSIAATDANGKAITDTTYTSGVVTGVDTSSGTTVLQLGNSTVNASDVIEVTA